MTTSTRSVPIPAFTIEQWRRFCRTFAWRLREAGTSFHGVSAAIHALLLAALLFGAYVPDIRGEAQRFVESHSRLLHLIEPPEAAPELLRQEDSLCGGDEPAPYTLPVPASSAAGDSGRAGNEVAPLARSVSQQAIEERDPESGSIELARATARDTVQSRGLLDVMNRPESVFGVDDPTGLDAVSAIGAIDGPRVGESWGSRGLGAYGGGLGAGGLGGTGRASRGGFEAGIRRINTSAAESIPLEAAVSRRRPITTDPGGYGVDVEGQIDREQIERVVRENLRGVRACYEAGLRGSPDLEGDVTIRWIIGPDGAVAGASVQESTMASPDVEACLVSRVRRFRFPEPRGGGIVRVNYPFRFSPVQ